MTDPMQMAQLSRAQTALSLAMSNTSQTGIGFVRRTIARYYQLDESACIRRWPADGDMIYKASVPSINSTDIDQDARIFINLAAERSVIGRLQNLRKIPFNTRVTKITSGALAYWSGETKLRPLSKAALAGETLPPLTLSAITTVTQESFSNPGAEPILKKDLVDATSGVLDQTFLSDDGGIEGRRPGGVVFGAPSVNATGNIADDLAALLSIFTGDLETATIITTPSAAVRLAIAAGGNPQILVGPNGGTLFGFPVLTTRHIDPSSNGDRLIIIDAAGVTANYGGIGFSKSTAATLAMSDTPEEEPEMVSLFQTNTIGLLTKIEANWNVSRAGAVAVLEGI